MSVQYLVHTCKDFLSLTLLTSTLILCNWISKRDYILHPFLSITLDMVTEVEYEMRLVGKKMKQKKCSSSKVSFSFSSFLFSFFFRDEALTSLCFPVCLELLSSNDPPVSASQITGNMGAHHCTQLLTKIVKQI